MDTDGSDDEFAAEYDLLRQAIEDSRLSAPPPRCAPSRLLETATPSPDRLKAAAADTSYGRSLNSARTIMGAAWTNRVAALLPAGWRLGPCYGITEGEAFDPPCFDRLECTRIRSLGGVWSPGARGNSGFRFSILAQNEDEGVVEGCCLRVGHYELNDTFVLEPDEHVDSVALTLQDNNHIYEGHGNILELGFTSTHDQSERFVGDLSQPSGCEEEGDGRVIRSFYGRVKVCTPTKWSRMQGLDQDYKLLCALGVVYGPGQSRWEKYANYWTPRAPERFSDAATARANAVLALASADRGPLGSLPEVLDHHVLAFAIPLFG